jgi:uncharacterized protein involved in outer membrane biogenesis
MRHWRKVLLVAAVASGLLLVMFDWNWFRAPLQAFVTNRTQREFRVSDLHVQLGMTPIFRLRGLYFANASWGGSVAMATIGEAEFTVSVRDLLAGNLLIRHVALTDAALNFERAADSRKNWTLAAPDDRSPSRLRIGTLSMTRCKVQYVDHGMPFQVAIDVDTFDSAAGASEAELKAFPAQAAGAADAPVLLAKLPYTTRATFAGNYHEARFRGWALTGNVLSFEESGESFPLRGHLVAGTTTLDVEGRVADAARISAIDVRLTIAGQTLANLYPFLLLPLPASPPYRLEGHLLRSGAQYTLEELHGKIGQTDVAGSASYAKRGARPLLTAKLHSSLLRIFDLGPLIGVTTRSSAPGALATQSLQAGTSTRANAKATANRTSGERILPSGMASGERLLPDGAFEGGRLKAIDAEVQITADEVRMPGYVQVNQVTANVDLKDGVLRLAPLDFAMAGGQIVSQITLDARQPALRGATDIAIHHLKLAQLLPNSPKLAKAQGTVGGRIILSGVGPSIADFAARSNGRISLLMTHGEISNLLDAAAGLNGGKVLQLLIRGDRQIALRCGAAVFEVKAGQGQSKLLVVDTAQTRIDGAGSFDLDHERFDVTITPRPKRTGILSLRTPVRLFGSFRHPDYTLDKQSLALRAGGAVALALLAPFAALLPLIETGPGADADCAHLFPVKAASGSASTP